MEYWFQEFDRDGSGQISRYELKEGLFFCFGEDYSEWEIDQMVWQADEDGDGKINFREFVNVMTRDVYYTSSSSEKKIRKKNKKHQKKQKKRLFCCFF